MTITYVDQLINRAKHPVSDKALVEAMVQHDATMDLFHQYENLVWNEAVASGNTAKFIAEMILERLTGAEKASRAASYGLVGE